MQMDAIITKTIRNKKTVAEIACLTDRHYKKAMQYQRRKQYSEAQIQRKKYLAQQDPQCTFNPCLITNKYNRKKQSDWNPVVTNSASVQDRLISWGKNAQNSKIERKTEIQMQYLNKLEEEKKKVWQQRQRILKQTKKILYEQPKSKIYGLRQYYSNKQKAQAMKAYSQYLFRLDNLKHR